jgi:acetate kinase
VTRILVVNAGSTSLKLSIVTADDASERVPTLADAVALRPDAVAHRVVHGGAAHVRPLILDDAAEAELRELIDLAPLHNGPALRGIDEARSALPLVPHVAVFDTAFHATLPAVAATYALPHELREGLGIRRFGFHGLSVAWAAERVTAARLAVCHLGGGSSVTAVRDGASVDTSMGFTPLEGVPMATRAGSVDPGALLHVLRSGWDVETLDRLLEHESGLAALAGRGGRHADLEAAAAAGDATAAFALDLYAYRVAATVAAMTVPLGGLDALVFTGGIGEGSAATRAAIAGRLAHLGVELDADANAAAVPDADVARASGSVRVVVVAAREDVVAARAARSMLGG